MSAAPFPSAAAPVIAFPPELPVSAARDEIRAAISAHQVVIVAGATGSGKTTQLPKICLELGRSAIAHTQPRRIAARTIAERIAEEMQVPLGSTVGYKVRFTDTVSEETKVALVTDGILLNEIHRDRLLRRYDTIIVDEAHERSLNIDFLLGYLARLLPDRPDLKVVITSATIDPESFARHFADASGAPAPIVEVSGRTYPVDIRYRPLVADADGSDAEASVAGDTDDEAAETAEPVDEHAYDVGGDEIAGLQRALRELESEPRGDVLVFLPGESEIRDAADALRGMYAGDAAPTEVLPLYGRLSAAEQHRVFERSTVAGVRRRVILATNVAETSLTVPGIRYVIDVGTARISRYSARSKVQRLPIEPVSQASAQQRSGRAGRTTPGIAIRLYGHGDFLRRPEYTEPEILRTSLASVLLQMLSLGFGEIERFPFLTPPDSRGVKAALDLLVELQAVRVPSGAPPTLTRIGSRIARMPIDPRFARMILEAERAGVARDVVAIVAGLSIQDVRERPEERREEADRLHARFVDPGSDFLTLLNLWNHLREKADELGSSAFRRLCRAEHLNYVRVREWFDVHRQIRRLAREGDGGGRGRGRDRARGGNGGRDGGPDASGTADPDAIHRAILSGLLSHIGILDERARGQGGGKDAPRGRRPAAEYRGARGVRFAVFPGSGLKKKSPGAVMAAELVETSRLFARTVAAIDPAWAEPLAGDLVKRQLSEPHWSAERGAALAYEKVLLFGVEIVSRRRVSYARTDPAGARELFLRHALVEGEWDATALGDKAGAFLRANRELRLRLERLEERERRRDILVGDEAVYAFYDRRVPADVVDQRAFESWWKDAVSRTPNLLRMREADLTEGAERADASDYPSRWTQGDQTLQLTYRFEPGATDDGVSVVVPIALLQQLRTAGFDWQVPGLRPELVTALLRALPKAIRRSVVPAADFADRFQEELAGGGPEAHDGLPPESLVDALARLVQRQANQPVTRDAFDLDRVPGHLRMNFRVVDGRGRAIGQGRDLGALQERLAERARESVAARLARPAGPQGSKGQQGPAAPAGGAPAATPDGPARPSPATPAAPAAPEQEGLTAWTFGALPESVDTRVAGGVVRGYPSLVDDGASVSLRMQATPEEARRLTPRGIRRLVLLAVPSPADYVLEHLTAAEKLALTASPYPSARALIEDARGAVADDIVRRTALDGIVRDEASFARVRDAVSAGIVEQLFATVSRLAGILVQARELDRAIKGQNSLALLAPLADLRAQRDGLLFPGFVARVGIARLAHYPRYLTAATERVAQLADNARRDRVRMTEFERAAALYAEAGGEIPAGTDAPAALVHARWLLEEYRVSLWAQPLGTAEPVSLPRITKALKESR